MHYVVAARLISSNASELYRKLNDGTIAAQEPDGREIVAAMKRAAIDDHGIVRWSEVCYCASPLQHERETVYDHYFTEISVEQVEGHVQFDGQSLMDRLENSAR